jgi:predicted transposase YdaD
MTGVFDLESLVHVEQTYTLLISLQKCNNKTLTMITSFYDSGYQDGFAHGRIHGLIEGRALGREKGFEMWEEIGFYEGFALTWRAILRQQSKEDELS